MSVNNVPNNQQEQYKKPSFSKTCAGVTAGLLASSIPRIPLANTRRAPSMPKHLLSTPHALAWYSYTAPILPM